MQASSSQYPNSTPEDISPPTRILDLDRPVRACTNCVRAKARCSPGLRPGQACERCTRMKKVCQPSPPIRKRRTRSAQQPTSAKVEKLEETLDGLVTFLKSAAQNPSGSSAGPSGLPDLSQFRKPSTEPAEAIDLTHRTEVRPSTQGIQVRLPDTPSASACSDSEQAGVLADADAVLEISAEDAEDALDTFRTHFMKKFPFLSIPVALTARELRRDRPLLWLCIMTVANPNSTYQKLLSKEMRALFGREAYMKETRNMDFLLAVMSYVTWDRYYEKSITTSLTHLAISILFDLGLDRPPPTNPGLHLEYELKGARKPFRLTRSPTMEERRALMGCFLLTSLPSLAPKGSSMRWSGFCDDCLRILEESEEIATDAVLVRLVKLRLIAERVADLSLPDASDRDDSYKPSTNFYVRSLQSQLQHFKDNLTADVESNEIIMLEICHTEFSIYEIALSQVPNLFPTQSSQRIDYLYACLQANKRWVDVFLRISPGDLLGMPLYTYAEMTRVLIDIWRLSTFEHPQWDRALVHETINVSAELSRAVQNFAQVKQMAGLDPNDPENTDIFSLRAENLSALASWWESTMVPATTTAPGYGSMSVEEIMDMPMDIIDSWNWWNL